MSPKYVITLVATLIAAQAVQPASAVAKPKQELPPKFQKSPYSLMSLSVGYPNSGRQLRAKKLKKSPHLELLAKSKNNAYGHPALVLMLKRSSKAIAKQYPGSMMQVGDLSSKHGGPLVGHRSHQSGRDADIIFYAKDKKGRRVTPKKFVAYDANGNAKDGSGLTFDDERNWMLLVSWAKDDRAGLSHIFVSRTLRKRLLAFANKHKRHQKTVALVTPLLKQPESAGAHDDHFHVRIRCPKRHEGLCHEQPK